MFFLDAIILLFVLVPDLFWKVTLFGIDVKFSLVTVYYIYLAFRNELTGMLPLLVFLLIVLRPFMNFGFFPLSVALFTVLFIANRVRLQIYTEAYLTQAFWVFLLSILQHLILHLLAVDLSSSEMMKSMVLGILANSFLAFLSTVPMFLVCDRLHDFFGESRRRPKGSSFMIRRL